MKKKKESVALNTRIDKKLLLIANKKRNASGIKWPHLLESLLKYWVKHG